MTTLEPDELKKLKMRILNASNSNSIAAVPAIFYMVGVISGLTGAQAWEIGKYLFPVITVVFTGVVPMLYINWLVGQTFAVNPGEPPGARLERILKVPRKLEFSLLTTTSMAIVLFTGTAAIYFGKSLWIVPWSVTVVALLVSLMFIQIRLNWEKVLRPYALAEFRANPQAMPKGSGPLWVRQGWYLPYVFALYVLCSLATVMTIVVRQGSDTYEFLLAAVQDQANINQLTVVLNSAVERLARDSLLPISITGIYLLVTAALAAWKLSQYQTEGAQAVQDAMESLASGTPKLPEWVATDEVGDLSAASAKAFGRLKAFSSSLGESAHALWRSAEQLGLSTSKQSEALTHQATALQETQVTAQEIKHTSALTAQKADHILQQTEKADQISRSGEAAIQQSLDGLLEIGAQVKEMARQIRDLDQRTRQIANITSTVKDLADQSNMLALNAAIEAVRSGEHGKGFGVVAREIRTLADQSIRATSSVRSILQDISTAIRSTVSMTEKGTEKVEVSLTQVREFGNNIRDLSSIVRENAASVRQITAAVTQQNTGITQIFQAVNDLSHLMDQTMVQLRTSDEALDSVRSVTNKVSTLAGEHTLFKESGGSLQSGPLDTPPANR